MFNIRLKKRILKNYSVILLLFVLPKSIELNLTLRIQNSLPKLCVRRNSRQLLICLSPTDFFFDRCSADAVERADIEDFDVVVLGVDGVDGVGDNGCRKNTKEHS